MFEVILEALGLTVGLGALYYICFRSSVLMWGYNTETEFRHRGANKLESYERLSLLGQLKMIRQLTGRRPVFLYAFGSRKRVERVLDSLHPRSREIAEHKDALQLLEDTPGDLAKQHRKRLDKGLMELYGSVRRQDEIDGDAYVTYIEPELDALHELRRSATEAYFNSRQGTYASLDS